MGDIIDTVQVFLSFLAEHVLASARNHFDGLCLEKQFA